MSACPDCPKYGNPNYTGPRQATCCMQNYRKADMTAEIEAFKRQSRETELRASQTTINRHARRKAAKLTR